MNQHQTELYERLESNWWSSTAEIRRNYLRIIQIVHTDKNVSTSKDQSQEVNEAYRILKDHALRRVYDYYGIEGIKNNIEDAPEIDADLKQWLQKMESFGAKLTIDRANLGSRLTPILGWSGYFQQVLAAEPPVVSNEVLATQKYGSSKVGSDRNQSWVLDLPIYQSVFRALNGGKFGVINGLFGAINGIIAPTGSGKSIGLVTALLIHNANKPFKLIVVEPTQVVAIDMYKKLDKIFGHVDKKLIGIFTRDFRSFDKEKTCVLIVTPGIGAMSLLKNTFLITHMFIDEVHNCSLDVDLLIHLIKLEVHSPIRYLPNLIFFVASASREAVENVMNNLDYGTSFELGRKERKHSIHVSHWADISELTGGFTSAYSENLLSLCVKNSTDSPIEENANECNVTSRIMDILSFLVKNNKLPGDILVFVSGVRIMRDLKKKILDTFPVEDFKSQTRLSVSLYELHSKIKHNELIFKPSKSRKIILSTNVAETGMTIIGAKFVVDTMLEFQRMPFESDGFISRAERMISGMSVQQRMGRVGRLEDGYYLTIYSAKIYDAICDSSMHSRVDGEDPMRHLLNLAYSDLDINCVFDYVAPMPMNVFIAGIQSLENIGAIKNGDDIELTCFGEALGSLCLVQPELSALVLAGTVFNCQESMKVLAAALMVDATIPKDRRDGKVGFFSKAASNYNQSEHLALIAACEYANDSLYEIAQKEKASNSYRKLKEELDDLIYTKAYMQMVDPLSRIQLALERVNLVRCDDDEKRDGDDIVKMMCIAIAFGANHGEHTLIGGHNNLSFAGFSIPGGKKVFRAESDHTSNSGTSKIAVYYRVENYGRHWIGPVTLFNPLFFACFASPFNKIDYKDGAIVFAKSDIPIDECLKIEMPIGIFEVVKKARMATQELLVRAAGAPSPTNTTLVLNLINFAESIKDIKI